MFSPQWVLALGYSERQQGAADRAGTQETWDVFLALPLCDLGQISSPLWACVLPPPSSSEQCLGYLDST